MAVAVFPDKRRMVTGSIDKTLRLWDLKKGVMLKKMEGHTGLVSGLAVSRDGQLIASGDIYGSLMAWHGETGKQLTYQNDWYSGESKPSWMYKSGHILSLDISPDGAVLATGSADKTVKL